MIARLLIYSSIDRLNEEITKILASHLTSGNANHPDLLYFRAGEKFGIAESKKIKEFFSLKPYSAKGRVVVIENASVLTIEAQNALLKTIEELPKETVLILGTPSDANLLPTIISRCQVIKVQSVLQTAFGGTKLKVQSNNEEIEKLLNSSIAERFEYVEKLTDKEEFLHSLVSYFHKNLLNYPEFLKKLLQAEEWAKHNVNIRAILEYLMLVMPPGSMLK